MKLMKCNLCNWETYDSNALGMNKHELYHDAKMPYVARNKIFGKVEWEILE